MMKSEDSLYPKLKRIENRRSDADLQRVRD